MTDDLICQGRDWDVRLRQQLSDLKGVHGAWENPAVIGLRCYNMSKTLPDTWGWTKGYADVFKTYSPWSSGDIFMQDLKNRTRMPHIERKKVQGDLDRLVKEYENWTKYRQGRHLPGV